MELHELIEVAAEEIQRQTGVSEERFATRAEYIEFVTHCCVGAVVAQEGCSIEQAVERLRAEGKKF